MVPKPSQTSTPRLTLNKIVRSPCPGLNGIVPSLLFLSSPPSPSTPSLQLTHTTALANHAFLPPSGRNLTLPQLLTGLAAGLNIAPDFTTVIGAAGLLSSPNPLRGSFDLNDLSQHNFPIEHDASISRVEAALGNPTPFNAGKWAQYLSAFDGRAESDIPTVARAKSVRYADSVKTNPDFVYGVREAVLSYGENALWVQSLGDGGVSSGKARMDYAKVLFEEERLPYQEGWRVARVPVSLASLGGMVVGLFAESPTVGGEGVRVVG